MGAGAAQIHAGKRNRDRTVQGGDFLKGVFRLSFAMGCIPGGLGLWQSLGVSHPPVYVLLCGFFLLSGCGASSAAAPKELFGAGDAGDVDKEDMPGAGNQNAAQAALPAALPFRLPCGERDAEGCKKGCDEGQTEDCVSLAAMYLNGELLPKDTARAIAMLERGCELSSARACMKLGDVYHEGTLLKDEAQEAMSYRKACEAGANTGCVAAGRAFVEGKGVLVDAVFGALLLTRACERGNMWGCFELAHLYERGEGVNKNAERAKELYFKACNLGLDQGCLMAGPAGEVAPPRN